MGFTARIDTSERAAAAERFAAAAVASIRGWLEENRDLFAGAEERRERFAEAVKAFRRERTEQARLALLADARDYFGEWSQQYRRVLELTETPS